MKRLWLYIFLILVGLTLLWLPIINRVPAAESFLWPATILASVGFLLLIGLQAWLRGRLRSRRGPSNNDQPKS